MYIDDDSKELKKLNLGNVLVHMYTYGMHMNGLGGFLLQVTESPNKTGFSQ
jgi:hypothetical protein